jgi:glycosyltransferase involved in cell wall biosynthesis
MMASRPRLLIVSAEVPAEQSSSGFAPRLHRFLLAAREHLHVTLALVDLSRDGRVGDANRFPIDACRILSPPPARWREPTLRGRAERLVVQYPFDPLPYHAYPRRSGELHRLLRSDPPDAIVVYLPYLLGLLRECPADIPVVAVLEEPWEWVVESVLGSATRKDRWLARREADRFRRLYRWAAPRLAAAVVISEAEREYFSPTVGAGKLVVIPHGIDTEYYTPAAGDDAERDIDVLVVGRLRARHNLDGARRALAAAEGRGWRWAFVGETDEPAADALRGDGCLVTGAVPDTRPYYARARCVLVPALHGRGVKTTALQAWATGRPLVTSSFGAQGLPARAGENVLVGADPDELVGQVDAVLSDGELARRLGAAGRATVERERDVRLLASRFAELCLRTAGGGQPDPS